MAIGWSTLKTTKYPGIRTKKEDGAYVIRVKQTDPRTGRKPEITRVMEPGSTIEDALALRAELVGLVERGEYRKDVPLKRETLGDFALRWILRKKGAGLRKHTLERYADALEKHILPHLGDLYVDAIASRDIIDWLDFAQKKLMRNGKPYSRWSVSSWYSTLRNIVSDMVIEHELPRNPCQGVRGPRKHPAPRAERNLKPAQLGDFLRLVKMHCPQHHTIALLLAMYGLRWEEASALHDHHIDEKGMEIRIVQTQVRGVLDRPKNEKAKSLPLDADVLQAIREHQALMEIRSNPGRRQGIIFPNAKGGYRLPSSVSKGWRTVSETMGLDWVVTPHDLRRSYQNLLRQANVNQIVQQAMMGHSSDAMTEHYSHVDMEEKRAAQSKVVDFLKARTAKAG